MAYWGDRSDDCDYAFDTLGSYVAHLRDRVLADAEATIDEGYPEQTILVTLEAIRLLWERFPKTVACSFNRGDYVKCRQLFERWLEAAGPTCSVKRRRAILAEADRVFHSCDEMYRCE